MTSGCASRGELHDGIWDEALRVPFVSQGSEDLCGLAVAKMLSEYYGIPLALAESDQLIADAARDGGISGAGLKAAFQSSNYDAVIFPGTLDREATGLVGHLEKGRALIVMFGAGEREVGHYVLLVGYSVAEDRYLILDPNSGRRSLTSVKFRENWEPVQRFTLLAVPASALRK